YLRDGDPQTLRPILEHNREDVVGTAALLGTALRILDEPLTWADDAGELLGAARHHAALDGPAAALPLVARALELARARAACRPPRARARGAPPTAGARCCSSRSSSGASARRRRRGSPGSATARSSRARTAATSRSPSPSSIGPTTSRARWRRRWPLPTAPP